MSGIVKWRKSMSSGVFRFFINVWPPFLGAGIKVTQITKDYRFIEVKMKQHWYNTNYVGTHFGGSMYAMTDAFYMLILLKNLGNGYVVWDKAAVIEFKKPGRHTLRAVFTFSEEEIKSIKQKTDELGKFIFDKPVDIIDESNQVVASVIKTLYVRKKNATVSQLLASQSHS